MQEAGGGGRGKVHCRLQAHGDVDGAWQGALRPGRVPVHGGGRRRAGLGDHQRCRRHVGSPAWADRGPGSRGARGHLLRLRPSGARGHLLRLWPSGARARGFRSCSRAYQLRLRGPLRRSGGRAGGRARGAAERGARRSRGEDQGRQPRCGLHLLRAGEVSHAGCRRDQLLLQGPHRQRRPRACEDLRTTAWSGPPTSRGRVRALGTGRRHQQLRPRCPARPAGPLPLWHEIA
mmetsp:Transcript_57648/g.130007  ORF Transcript_57648/g.130007 Transcript_57648/m.130007 type:complete len:233 (+) Transcript_57648:248-946(+)